MSDKPLLQIHELRVKFPTSGGYIEALRGVNLRVYAGERIGLIGESGSGKSLTALSIMGLISSKGVHIEGSIALSGKELLGLGDRELAQHRGRDIAMVYQSPLSALNPVRSIGDQVIESIRTHADVSRRDAQTKAIDLLEEVGIPDAADRIKDYPHQFSGGMRQRVVIAMALSAECQLLIADEPTTALDVSTQARILELLDRVVQERGMAVVLITHDLDVAAKLCDVIEVMYAGRIVERAPTSELYEKPVHPYAEALIESIVDTEFPVSERIPSIEGQPPVAGSIPHGCSFHPRCLYAEEICRSAFPPKVQLSEGQFAECHFAQDRFTVMNRLIDLRSSHDGSAS